MLHGLRRLVLAALLSLTAAPALAQPTTLPANSVICRLGISPGPPQACPLGVLAPALVPLLTPYFPGVTSLDGATGAVTASTSDKVCFVSTAGSNAKSGLGWQTAKLTPQACEDAVATGGIVVLGAGTYTLSATYAKRPHVTTWCVPGATLTQGTNANLVPLIDWATHSADYAALRYCTVDGNNGHNAYGDFPGVSLGSTVGGVLDSNTFQNFVGHPVYFNSATACQITNNIVKDFYGIGIYSVPLAANIQSNCRITGNTVSGASTHAASFQHSDGITFTGNDLAGYSSATFTCNVAGTTITRTAGTGNFSSAKPGMFLVYNSGQESSILSVTNANSAELFSAPGNVTGVTCVVATGDLLAIANLKRGQFSYNKLNGGGTVAVSLTNGIGGEDLADLQIEGNQISNSGEYGISIQNVVNGTVAYNIPIVGNTIANPGAIGAASSTGARSGIGLSGTSANLYDIPVLGNAVWASNTLMPYCIDASGIADGGARVGANSCIGAAHDGINGGIRTIDLTGWGAGATSTNVMAGTTMFFSIVAGATPSTNPHIVVSTRATKPGSPVQWQCNAVGGAATIAPLGDTNASDPTIMYGTYFGTPVNGSTYNFQCN